MKDGLVRLGAIDAALPKQVRAQLDDKRAAIVAGRFKPFSGRLLDNTGGERLARGSLDDAAIAGMDWLAAGVVGRLPGQ
jgi:simple sugar transport system substrate-binding protein